MAKLGVPSGHFMDYENSQKHWDRYQLHYRRQNYVLRELCQDVNISGMSPSTVASNTNVSGANNTSAMRNGVAVDQRVTTRSVMKMFNQFVQHFNSNPMVTHSSGILRRLRSIGVTQPFKFQTLTLKNDRITAYVGYLKHSGATVAH